ncbi:MAG: nitrilase family protein, partial [Cyclobacteriaceae bacterium]|nr:nitrilase family protein [Cyclobacteriaceae bacterium]
MSSHTLNISLIQSNLHWESPAANRAMFEEKISPLKGNTDIIVLPEMFSTGFTMNTSENAELMNLHTHKWMKQIADYTGAVVTGSMIVQEGNNYYNRLLWISPEGPSQGYDKKHLFRMAEEHHHFSPGQSRLITHLKGWKV